MDTLELLDHGFTWTTARIAAVPADGLDAPTPCGLWDLRGLLDHTIGSLTMLTDAVAGTEVAAAPASWDQAIAELAARSSRVWRAPGVMDRTVELPMGAMPASTVTSVTLLETVVHGWDISQGSGEQIEIPEALALPILEFARQALPADRGDDFAADLGVGVSASPSEQLVAFLGRKPR
jgi:uncharacterized protein (TIGR03086 family)